VIELDGEDNALVRNGNGSHAMLVGYRLIGLSVDAMLALDTSRIAALLASRRRPTTDAQRDASRKNVRRALAARGLAPHADRLPPASDGTGRHVSRPCAK
jgi:hypothetical protein